MIKKKALKIVEIAWSKINHPKLGNFRFDILNFAYQLLPLINGLNNPRFFEWQFALKHLPKPPAKVIDVGTTNSLFPFKLAALGYKTHCLDQKKPDYKFPSNIFFHQDNLLKLKLRSNTFNAVTSISVIEHIGMGKYKDPKASQNSYLKAIMEMLRILKPQGHLIITTNTSNKTHIFNQELCFGKKQLEKIFSLGKLLNLEYRYFNGRSWIIDNKNKAFKVKGSEFGLAMFVLKKN